MPESIFDQRKWVTDFAVTHCFGAIPIVREPVVIVPPLIAIEEEPPTGYTRGEPDAPGSGGYCDRKHIFGVQEQGERTVRDRLLLGLGLVGAAMVFCAIAVRSSRSVSIPCPLCGRTDDLASVDPIGIHLDKAVLWNCQCGNTRAVLITRYVPRALIEKALTRKTGSQQP